VWVGFAAETRRLDAEARRKLREKRLDMIVANDVSARDAGFEVQTNRAVIFTRSGERIALPLMSKARLAGLIVRRLEQIRATQGGRA